MSVVSGYDDAKGVLILQDSYRGPDAKLTYEELLPNWRAFNYVYMVVFPAGEEHDARVRELLGSAADIDVNYHEALARSKTEALNSTGEQAAFAWFNIGTNLVYLKDYAGAAQAFDQARQLGLPYRMVWYQFGPYLAYYYMARYQDIVDLATFALNSTPQPGLEEAYYWRARALQAIGLPDNAIADYRLALQWHPGYQPALDELNALGVTP